MGNRISHSVRQQEEPHPDMSAPASASSSANQGTQSSSPQPIYIVMTHTCDPRSTDHTLSNISGMFDDPGDAMATMEDFVRRHPPAHVSDVEEYVRQTRWDVLYDGYGDAVGVGYQYLAKDDGQMSIWISAEL